MISYLYAALIAVGTLVIGILLGIWIRKRAAKRAEEKISNADEEALRIVNEAIKSAENKKREVMLEAKEDILRSRNEYEKEVKERRAEQQKQERRLQQKEENLDRAGKARGGPQPEACRPGQGKRRNQDHQAQPNRNA